MIFSSQSSCSKNSFLFSVFLFFLRFLQAAYRVAVRPFLVGGCRFPVSCSQYAVQTFAQYHFLRACGLVARRLWRCRAGGPCID